MRKIIFWIILLLFSLLIIINNNGVVGKCQIIRAPIFPAHYYFINNPLLIHYSSIILLLLFSLLFLKKQGIKFLLIACFFIGCSSIKQDNEKHYIPNGYRGLVMIFYNKPDGEKPFYDKDNARIFTIKDGILKTRFLTNRLNFHDAGKMKFYYKSEDGSTRELPYISKKEARNMPVKDSSEIVVFEIRNGLFGKDNTCYTSYEVDTYKHCTYIYFDPLYPDE